MPTSLSMRDIAQTALNCLDLTSLDAVDDVAKILKLCHMSKTAYGKVAAICVWPKFVAVADAYVPSDIKIATVVNFPAGSGTLEEVVNETIYSMYRGADEIDLVFPYQAFMRGEVEYAKEMVQVVKKIIFTINPKAKLKVILESGYIEDPLNGGSFEMLQKASALAIMAGADFLKTSTGKYSVGATLSAVTCMASCIKELNPKVGLKVSGGVKTVADSKLFMNAISSILGEAYLQKDTFRIGASSILSDIFSVIAGPSSLDLNEVPNSNY